MVVPAPNPSDSPNTARKRKRENSNSASTQVRAGSNDETPTSTSEAPSDAYHSNSSFLEVDENNVIRTMYFEANAVPMDPAYPADEFLGELTGAFLNQETIWRSPDNVAIEVNEFGMALALHDLSDESNCALMTRERDRILLQGVLTQRLKDRIHMLGEDLGSGRKIMVFLRRIDGNISADRRRSMYKGLENIWRQNIVLAPNKVEELKSKVWETRSHPSLTLVQFLVTDPSFPDFVHRAGIPPKTGRRLERPPKDDCYVGGVVGTRGPPDRL
ncbi:hypothetical protein F4778DRAFT_601419 [Xylariomycetidae sp. FL2044]|nr:hypothetical protein F4778DRAFT_601419 [Xylariomycetidae sp. FL2044]